MRHPNAEMLLAHATGEADLPLRLVVEGHLEFCPDCRAEVADFAGLGGALLAGLSPLAPSPGAWAKIERALDAVPLPAVDEAADAGAREGATTRLPISTRRELASLGALSWERRLLNGAEVAELARDPDGAVLYLAHMPGGRKFPRHEHLGEEQVVVLAGGYDDERGAFERGDFGEYLRGTEHGPTTLDGEQCWLLFRLAGTIRFRGYRGVLQRIFGA